MPKTLAGGTAVANTLHASLIALKPRQVLLSKPDMGQKESGDGDSKTLTLKADQKVLLIRSVGQFLDRSGFSKTLKKFLSEAEIEKNDLGGTSLDLEEIFCKYLQKGDQAAGDREIHGKSNKDLDDDCAEASDKKKKRKQKTVESDGHTLISAEASRENTDDIVSDDHEKKQKEKKKKSKNSKCEGTEEKSEDGSSERKGETVPEMELKPKDKKNKKKKIEAKSDSLDENAEEVNGEIKKESDTSKSRKQKPSDTESRKDENKTSEEDEGNKVSKKRKRLEGEEHNAKPDDNKDDEDSKRRKKDSKENNNGVEKTPVKQADGQENGNLEITGARSATEKSWKKEQNGSKEPKKPFQRVNVEEVVFTDDRLQDNSYWAKDGADTGYGAKAQEILGQVRGRGFRHEKTKKKRGSYRGGQIDLQSHSIKFDNSDDE